MVDFASVQSAVGSLKISFDMTNKFLEMKSVGEAQGLVIALQREILAAQNSAFGAQTDLMKMATEVQNLKSEIARMRAWDEQKQGYSLVRIFAGSFAYALKEECSNGEPPHWICTNCYENGVKSILAPRQGPGDRGMRVFRFACPRCKADIQSPFTNASTPKFAAEYNSDNSQ